MKNLALAVLLAAPASAARTGLPEGRPVLEELRGLAPALVLEVPALPGQEVDALGRPVSPETRRAYDRLLRSLNGRRLSAREYDLLLALMNQPPVPSGPFKDRDALVAHFAKSGVGLKSGQTAVADSDLWRLVRAARAAATAFDIPPAVLLCLTFRESSFDRSASAWTTSAKGVGQLTNGAAADMVTRIQKDADTRRRAQAYAAALGAEMPARYNGAPDVDALTRQIQDLRKAGAPAAQVEAKKKARAAAIAAHKDEPGHIYNLETNFGLTAAYLSYLRRARLAEVTVEDLGWYTAVAAYNQGVGTANELIYKVYAGAADYNARLAAEVFTEAVAAKLSLSADRRHEMLGEVGSVQRCAGR